MSEHSFTNEELTAYLDETLSSERASVLEESLRRDESLRRRLAGILRHRDQGTHSVGEVWRRGRLSCLSRDELGGFLLGTLEAERERYAEFHLRTIGCRYCLANLRDLEEAARSTTETTQRRRRFFESSAGLLRSDD